MLLVVLCNFNVPFGKLFSKIISNFFHFLASKVVSTRIIAPTAPSKFVEEVEV